MMDGAIVGVGSFKEKLPFRKFSGVWTTITKHRLIIIFNNFNKYNWQNITGK